jgi:hypothetical protein
MKLETAAAMNMPQTAQPTENKFPGLIIELASKGLFYPEGHPLSTGKIEMKYMTAKEEDILTTESYINSGIVLDKLFESMIITPVDYKSILLCDKDSIMIASRVYGYGEMYGIKVTAPSGAVIEQEINLNDLQNKEFDTTATTPGLNEFTYTVESTKDVIKFKLLTIGDQQYLDAQKKKYKTPGSRDNSLTFTLAQMIVSVNGNDDKNFVALYVQNMRALESRKFREYVKTVQPGVDMTVELLDPRTSEPFRTQVTPGLDFFWPDVRV